MNNLEYIYLSWSLYCTAFVNIEEYVLILYHSALFTSGLTLRLEIKRLLYKQLLNTVHYLIQFPIISHSPSVTYYWLQIQINFIKTFNVSQPESNVVKILSRLFSHVHHWNSQMFQLNLRESSSVAPLRLKGVVPLLFGNWKTEHTVTIIPLLFSNGPTPSNLNCTTKDDSHRWS